MHAIRTLMDFDGRQGKNSVVGNIFCDYPLSVALINSKNAYLISFFLLHASRIYVCFVTCVKHIVSTSATSESFLGIMKCRKNIFFYHVVRWKGIWWQIILRDFKYLIPPSICITVLPSTSILLLISSFLILEPTRHRRLNISTVLQTYLMTFSFLIKIC